MKNETEKYLQYLRCPTCKKKLRPKGNKFLICYSGKHIFSIRNGIPRLLNLNYAKKSQKETRRSFSYKWTHKFSQKYGFDGVTDIFQHNWYLDRYGWKKNAFKNFIKKQKFILDAGCGSGWGAGWFAANNPDATVFAVDISDGVEQTKRNVKNLKNVIVVQADINNLPFPNNFFDFISCDQVLHHLPNPPASFKKLKNHLKKGGILNTYVYKVKALLREMADIVIREETTKMSPEDCYKFSRAITMLGKSLSDLKIEFKVPESIPLLGIKKGRYELQRFIYWYFLKCFWNDEWGMERSLITNFDWYHPKDAYRYTPEEIKKWIKKEKLKLEKFDIGDSGISIRVKK